MLACGQHIYSSSFNGSGWTSADHSTHTLLFRGCLCVCCFTVAWHMLQPHPESTFTPTLHKTGMSRSGGSRTPIQISLAYLVCVGVYLDCVLILLVPVSCAAACGESRTCTKYKKDRAQGTWNKWAEMLIREKGCVRIPRVPNLIFVDLCGMHICFPLAAGPK